MGRSSGREARERRLRSEARFEPGEQVRARTRAWVSQVGRLPRLLESRTRDLVVVTDRRLLVFATGFFTGRLRRRVVADRLEDLAVADDGRRPGRHLRVERPDRPALRIDLGRRRAARAVAAALVAEADRPRAGGDPTGSGASPDPDPGEGS